MITSILHVQPYMTQNYSLQTSRVYFLIYFLHNYCFWFYIYIKNGNQNNEVTFNSLLMATGALGFIIAILAAVLSCMAGNCCINRRVSFRFYIREV